MTDRTTGLATVGLLLIFFISVLHILSNVKVYPVFNAYFQISSMLDAVQTRSLVASLADQFITVSVRLCVVRHDEREAARRAGLSAISELVV